MLRTSSLSTFKGGKPAMTCCKQMNRVGRNKTLLCTSGHMSSNKLLPKLPSSALGFEQSPTTVTLRGASAVELLVSLALPLIFMLQLQRTPFSFNSRLNRKQILTFNEINPIFASQSPREKKPYIPVVVMLDHPPTQLLPFQMFFYCLNLIEYPSHCK